MLPDEEKIHLVNEILASMDDEKKNYAVPESVITMVSERIEAYKKDPSSALNIEDFKRKLNERFRNK